MASSETINGVELRHHYARVNGILQHYVVADNGEPMVLLHGFAQTWRMWPITAVGPSRPSPTWAWVMAVSARA